MPRYYTDFVLISAVLTLLTFILTNGPAMAGTIDFRGVVKPEGNVVTVKALCDYKPSGPDDAQLSLTIRKRSKDGPVLLAKVRDGLQSAEQQDGAEVVSKDVTDNSTMIPKSIHLEEESSVPKADESGVYFCTVRTRTANYTSKLIMMVV